MENIIGREYERRVLDACYESERAELVAVYGRRRVGKTFLIKNHFNDKIDFYVTGMYNATKKEHLQFFNRQLCAYSGLFYPIVDNWFDAFEQLKHFIINRKDRKVLVFIDELPWLDTPRSNFIKAFELFWNSWAADCNNLKLIVCGSATTWMTARFLGNKGGLHNRVTRRIRLFPFNLAETEMFLESQGIVWNRHQICEAYMIMGGTPYYLQKLEKQYSLSQNIDLLFFSENADLRDEYGLLFRSLFNDSAVYRSVVELLSKKNRGMTRMEIKSAMKMTDGGSLTMILNNLCDCDFIRRYSAFGKKERDVLYQLTDMFSLFYLRYVKNYNGKDLHFWSNSIDSAQHRAWSGYAFEQLCLHHIMQIKQKLGISGIHSDVSSWSQSGNEDRHGAQIDLIIDRNDQIINLCEMKFSSNEFEITKKYYEELQARRELFRTSSKTRKAIHYTFVTTYGLKKNQYEGMIQSQVRLEDLFAISSNS